MKEESEERTRKKKEVVQNYENLSFEASNQLFGSTIRIRYKLEFSVKNKIHRDIKKNIKNTSRYQILRYSKIT